MNYLEPGYFRAFAFPYMDDAMGIRAAYPSNAVARTDWAVYLYYETNTCSNLGSCVADATYPSNVVAGGNLTVNNYHVENVGTTTIPTPTITWYLTTARTLSAPAYLLGSTTYSSLPPANWFTPSSVSRTFTVPASVPAGNYYLFTIIANDASP